MFKNFFYLFHLFINYLIINFKKDLENDYKLPLETSLPKSFIPSRIKNFIGETNIGKIEESFFRNNKKIVNLTSNLKSVGKSAIANEYAHRFEKKQEALGVFWMKSNENNLDLEFCLFALNFFGKEFEFKSSREEIIKEIKSKLKRLEKKGKILFVFDDCDLVYNHFYTTEMSSLKNVFILITSDKMLDTFKDQNMINNISVEPFETAECKAFLQNKLELDDSKCGKFLEILGLSNQKLLPNVLLKLILLYNLKVGLSSDFNAAINKLKEMGTEKSFLNENLYLEELIKSRKNLWQLLKLFSILDADFIPYKIFTEIFLFEEEYIEACILFLCKSSMVFVEEKETEKGIRVHNFLKDDIKNYLKDQPIELTNEQFQNLFQFMSVSLQKHKYIFIFNFNFLVKSISKNPFITAENKETLEEYFKKYLDRFKIFSNENSGYVLDNALSKLKI